MRSYGFVVMCAIPRSGEKKASPQTPLGLTPSPSPSGEGSGMPCELLVCYWLTYYLLASLPAPLGLTPCPSQPHPQPLSKGRGEWCALCIACLLLVNWLTCQLLSFSSDCFFCPLFSNNFNTMSAILFTNSPLGRKKSILTRVGFHSKWG